MPREQFPEKIFKNAHPTLFLCCLQTREGLHSHSSVLHAKLFAVLPCILPFLLFIHLKIFIELLLGVKSYPGAEDKIMNKIQKVALLVELTFRRWVEWRQRVDEQVHVLCGWRKQSHKEGRSQAWPRERREWTAMASLTLKQSSE